MNKLAIVLVHNKNQLNNFSQIEFFKPLINKIKENHTQINEDGSQFDYISYHYEINVLPGYEVKFYQVIPFGVIPPKNLDDIDSHKVFYGSGDEDKIGDNPQFFNWGLKRSTDYGADIVLYLSDEKKFDIEQISLQIKVLEDKENKTELIQSNIGIISTVKLLREVGLIPHGKTIDDYKNKIIEKGLEYG